MIDPQDYFFVEEIIFPECGGVTGENESMNETQAPESQAIESTIAMIRRARSRPQNSLRHRRVG